MLATHTLTWDVLMDMLVNNKTEAQPKIRKKGGLFNWANRTPKFLSPTESHYYSSEPEGEEEDGNLSSALGSEGS